MVKKNPIDSSCDEKVSDALSKLKIGRTTHDALCLLGMWGNILLVWVVILVLTMHYKIFDNEKTRSIRGIIVGVTTFVYLGSGIMLYFYLHLKPQFGDCAVAADPMNKKLFNIGKFPISQWPLSHFILFMGFGFFMPRWWWVYILFGVGWEGVELLMKHLQKKNAKTARTRVNANEYTYLTYWESTIEDIILNTAGVAVGVGLAKLVDMYRPFGLHYRQGFIHK